MRKVAPTPRLDLMISRMRSKRTIRKEEQEEERKPNKP